MRDHRRRSAAGVAALLLCSFFCLPVAPASAQPPDRYAAIDRYVQERMKATRTPGLSYAVVDSSGPVHQRWWGTDGHGEPVTADTPFLWGSVAKPVAATGAMALVRSGRLRLDDRVVDHLPGFGFGGAAHAGKVTVRHLLNQTAGLPASATFEVTDCLGAACPRPAERLSALDDVPPLGPPGTAYAYTSANYLVLAAVVEAATGRPYAEHLRRDVLDPAGMVGAIADAASARNRGLSPGHQHLWGFPAAVADGFDHHGASYGYLGGDLHDLAAFASFQLRSTRAADGDAVLTPESVRLMREEGELRPAGTGTGYGLGWRVGGLDAPLDDAVWHTGATFGYSAMIFLLAEQGTALVLQQNLHGLLHDTAVMQVGFGAAEILAGGDPPAEESAAVYHLAVWGTTALALALVAAAVRSALLLRRPVSATPLRRAAVTTVWVLAGASPWVPVILLLDQMGPEHLWNWLPDFTVALYTATAAGTTTALLRLARPAASADPVEGRE